MHGGISGDECSPNGASWISFQVSDDPTRFLNNQHTGSDVPRRESQLPECVKSSTSYVGKVQRRRPRATNSRGPTHHQTELRHVLWQHLESLERKAGPDQRAGRLSEARNPHLLPIQEGPAASYSGEFVTARNVQNNTGAHHSVAGDCDRNRVLWVAVQKVRGTVERIRDYDEPLGRHRGWGQLLAQHDRFREAALDDLNDSLLGCLVDLTDEIGPAFRLPNELVAVSAGIANHDGTRASRFERDVEKLQIVSISSGNCLQLLSRAL